MTTPKRAEILEKALELYAKDQYRNGCEQLAEITPEYSELAESGYISTAMSELMRDNPSHAVQEWQDYDAETENLEGFKFDTREAMNTTTFISGSRGTGKSDTAMYAVDQLKNEGIICVAFDSSLDWIRRSSISRYVTLRPYSILEVPMESTIFDISLLTPMEQQKIVEHFSEKLFTYQLNSNKKYYIIFEECQNFFSLNSLRSKKTQNSMRLLTVGRNLNVSICAISQFPATCDKELIKNSGQIYVGYCAEPNTLAYWKGILDTKTSQLKELLNGQFLYYHRNKIDKIEIQPYENTTPKTAIPTPQPKPLPTPQKTDNYALAKAAFIGIIGLIWLWITLGAR